MKISGRRIRRNKIEASINITPMVDVAFTLLIIFVIAAPFLHQGMPVNLPQADAPALKQTQSDVIVSIKKDGSLYIGDKSTPVTIPQLESELTTMYSTKLKKDLFLKADGDLQYKTIVKVMSVAKNAGVDRIGMLTQPEAK